MHGNLIEPQDYRRHLQGALAQVHFSLTHWAIGSRSGEGPIDIYTADICNMRVLSPPANYGMAVTPRKRKFHAKDPVTPDIRPKRFRNFAEGPAEKEGEEVKEGADKRGEETEEPQVEEAHGEEGAMGEKKRGEGAGKQRRRAVA
ncbi:hypothetical protein JOM56_012206 [Amanita muscaria]